MLLTMLQLGPRDRPHYQELPSLRVDGVTVGSPAVDQRSSTLAAFLNCLW